MIGSEVMAIKSNWSLKCAFCLVMELAQGGSVTNGATPSFFLFTEALKTQQCFCEAAEVVLLQGSWNFANLHTLY